MAIAAIQTQAGYVMLMAERNRLVGRNVLVGNVGRALQFQERRSNRRKEKHHAKNAGARQSICTTVEDLSHEYYVRENRGAHKHPAAVPPLAAI